MAAIPLGDLEIPIINLRHEDIATAIQDLLVAGSQKGKVTPDDLHLIRKEEPYDEPFSTVAEGLEHGNKFFDMLCYFCIDAADRPEPQSPDPGSVPEIITTSDLSDALFYVAFYLLTRGSPPSGDNRTVGPAVPAFLWNILGLREAPGEYAAKLASFELSKMSHRWIEYINWTTIGAEAQNRFGLGVAGYRMFAPFKLYTAKSGASAEAIRAYEWARHVATQPADWSIHSVTRDPNILQHFGNLNKNLANLILECFTEAEITEMVANRVLFAAPTRDPRHTNWRGWSTDDLPVLTRPIFG